MPSETLQERIERMRSILLFRLNSFKSEFLPFRERYEEQVSAQLSRFFNSVPGGLDGNLAHIERIITDGKLDIYQRGAHFRTDDAIGDNTSAWNALVTGKINRIADAASAAMGTTYTVSSTINKLGSVEHRYHLKTPVDNEAAERIQAALTEAFGAGWPLLTEDQLRILNQRVAAASNAINTWTQAIVANPDGAEVFQRNITRLEKERAEYTLWIGYIKAGVLPGDSEPQAVLESRPMESLGKKLENEAAFIDQFNADQDAIQRAAEIEANAISKAEFDASAKGEFESAELVKQTDPTSALQTPSMASRMVEDVSTTKALPDVTETDSSNPAAILGAPTGFIPDPVDPVDPAVVRTLALRTPEFDSDVDDFSDRMVDAFNSEFQSLNEPLTAKEPTAGPDNNADPDGAKKKLLIAAIISAFIFKAF